MKKRIAIGAAIALLASIAFATVASASDQFDNGTYSVELPDGLGTVDFTVTDGTITVDDLPDGFTLVESDDESDDVDSFKLSNGLVKVEIEADDDADGGIDVDVESLSATNDVQADDDSISTDETERRRVGRRRDERRLRERRRLRGRGHRSDGDRGRRQRLRRTRGFNLR